MTAAPLNPTNGPMSPTDALWFVTAAAAAHLPAELLDPDDILGSQHAAAQAFDVPAVVARAFAEHDGLLHAHDWLTPKALHLLIEEHRQPARPAPTDLPCPEWCDEPAGHPFHTPADDDLEQTHWRTHRHALGERRAASVSVIQVERTALGDALHGPSDLNLDPDALTIESSGTRYLSAAGARRIAADLQAAADLLDQLAGERTD